MTFFLGYENPVLLSTMEGNNALSYQERINKNGKACIILPSFIQINTIWDIQLWTEITLEEIDQDLILRTHTGLAHVYQLQDQQQYIFDNHNHALFFWLHRIRKHQGKSITLIHIDQHSDLNTPPTSFDPWLLDDDAYIRSYANLECQISSFIKPFLWAFKNIEFVWVKSEQQLLELDVDLWNSKLILDIDLDFRAPEMSPTRADETFGIVRELIWKASITTIATSPMFIDQELALEYLKQLIRV